MTMSDYAIVEDVRKYDRILAQQVRAILDDRDALRKQLEALQTRAVSVSQAIKQRHADGSVPTGAEYIVAVSNMMQFVREVKP